MSYYLFLIIAPLIALGFNVYAYKRFALKIEFLVGFKPFLRAIFILLAIFGLVFLLSLRLYELPLWAYLVGATSFGASFFLASMTLIYDICTVLSRAIKSPHDKARRKFIRTIFDISFTIFAVSMLLKGLFSALKPPKMRTIDIKLAGLKSHMRIAMISDVHIGEFLGAEFMAEIVGRINSAGVDAVFIVGDLVDTAASRAADMLAPLKELKSSYGTFYVTGNHEFYHGAKEIIELLESFGVNVLQNQNMQVGEINLAGVHDIFGKNLGMPADPASALKGTDDTKPTVMLAHQPRFISTLDELGLSDSVDLLLCGHTHAGQIFPFGLLVLLQQPYLHGLYRHSKHTQVYVSSGAGFWGPPVRVLAPSEIVILNLKEEL